MNDSLNFYRNVQQLAEGKLACTCGNRNWTEFLYIGTTDTGDKYLAACKQCGATYGLEQNQWKQKAKGIGQ